MRELQLQRCGTSHPPRVVGFVVGAVAGMCFWASNRTAQGTLPPVNEEFFKYVLVAGAGAAVFGYFLFEAVRGDHEAS